MKTKDIKKGISLIVLIITIIVVIILAAVVILTLSKNNPIESAKEARFKEDVRTFQDELALYISKQYTNAGGHWDGNISATTYDEIKDYIPSFTKKYEGKFIINNNNLEYTNELDEKEKEYAQSISIKEKVKLLPDEYQQVEYLEGIDGVNRSKIEVEDEIGINSKNLYVEAKLIFIPNNILSKGNRSIIFLAGTYKECHTAFYRDSQNYVAIYSGTAEIFPTVKNNNIIENKMAYITENYASVDNINIDISNTTDAETVYNKFRVAEGIGKFGFVNIYENRDGVKILRHRLIPSIDKNNTPCMYDIITNQAFYNKGTAEYIAGPIVND